MQGKMERGSRKRSSSAGSKKMDKVGGRKEKMEGHCSTGTTAQWTVVPMEEEEDKTTTNIRTHYHCKTHTYLVPRTFKIPVIKFKTNL